MHYIWVIVLAFVTRCGVTAAFLPGAAPEWCTPGVLARKGVGLASVGQSPGWWSPGVGCAADMILSLALTN